MLVLDQLLSAASLAMDAFAVSICVGALFPKSARSAGIRLAAACGAFQFAMPMIGHFIGIYALSYISSFDHWVAFGLLALVGGNMIREALSNEAETSYKSDPTKDLTLITIAVATSIDALAVGASFAISSKPVLLLAIAAGAITAALCIVGALAGGRIGSRYGERAELVGGVVLITIGLLILKEHLF